MSRLKRFSSPALLNDFDDIPGQAKAWHQGVNKWFESSIQSERSQVKSPTGRTGTVQFYNPVRSDPKGDSIIQPFVWNAFPKELLRQFGRDRALAEAEKLRTVDQYSKDLSDPIFHTVSYRPQNEYCEWHTVRNPRTHKIVSVTFSSEPPEYWRAMFGEVLNFDDGTVVNFPGNRYKVLALYRELVSPAVQMEDLIAPQDIPNFAIKGGYNMFNKWNTELGIVHLCSPPNALQAEIQLGADATILRADGTGKPIVLSEPLICCSQYGNPNRNSDPTIGSSINALARSGRMITLADPVGLYIDHIDLTGWACPDGSPPANCVRIVRGCPEMIARLVVEVPEGRTFTIGDMTIGGTKIEYGGQIAECITVKLVGKATVNVTVKNAPASCQGNCTIDPNQPTVLKTVPCGALNPAGTMPAFLAHGGSPPPAPSPPPGPTPPVQRIRRLNPHPNHP